MRYHSPIENKTMIMAKFASKDETRHHLTYVWQSKDLNKLVACDGHRLIYTDALPIPEKPFKASVYLKTRELSYFSGEKFNETPVKQIIPDLSKYGGEFSLLVPEWLTKIESSRRPINFYFSKSQVGLIKNDDSLFALDARLLAPLTNLDIVLKYKDAISPVFFRADDLEGLIMPLRVT